MFGTLFQITDSKFFLLVISNKEIPYPSAKDCMKLERMKVIFFAFFFGIDKSAHFVIVMFTCHYLQVGNFGKPVGRVIAILSINL